MNADTRQQTIAIAAAIFAARDLASLKTDRELNYPRAVSAIDDAIIKAQRLLPPSSANSDSYPLRLFSIGETLLRLPALFTTEDPVPLLRVSYPWAPERGVSRGEPALLINRHLEGS